MLRGVLAVAIMVGIGAVGAAPAEADGCSRPVVLLNGEEVSQTHSPTLRCNGVGGSLGGGGARPRGLLGNFPIVGNLPGLGGIL
ncbi:membrane protein [Mycobacterium phage KashFlow]|nr:membrane protein [Mycobacterium phage KashFlow]